MAMTVQAVPGEAINPGDRVTFDPDMGRYRKAVAGRDDFAYTFTVPACALITEDGYMEIPLDVWESLR